MLLLSKLGYIRNIHNYTTEGILSVEEDDKTTIEEDLKNLSKKTNPKKTIFVIHSPPWGTKLDMADHNGAHIGSKAVMLKNLSKNSNHY